MRILLMVFLVLGSLAKAQTAAPEPPPVSPQNTVHDDDEDSSPTASQVPENAAVLTITGLCPAAASTTATARSGSAASSGRCETIITRAEFERLANAVSPGMKSETKGELAAVYPRMLVLAAKAEQQGLDKTPRFNELLRFVRVQALSQVMVHQIKEDSAKVSEQAIQEYYDKHSTMFEQATLERIFVPLKQRAEALPENTQAPVGQAEQGQDPMTREAEALRVRAAAGEDFTALQQAAYDAAGIKSAATPASLKKVRRSDVPASHAQVFDLQPGEISPVLNDATGHYIYKLVSKELPSLNVVKNEISNRLRDQNMREAMQQIQDSFSAQMNPAYFPKPAPPARRSPTLPVTP